MTLINEILLDGKTYKVVCFWRKSKTDKSKDSKGDKFPFPKIGNSWSGKQQFLEKIKDIQTYLDLKEQPKLEEHFEKCLLCNEKYSTNKKFVIGRYIWNAGLVHYVEQHNIKPPEVFIDKVWNFIFDNNINESNDSVELMSRLKSKNNKVYLKISKNQIMILDALMKHGGYSKKYYDNKNENVVRYSEHAGYIDIKEKEITNIIVMGNTMRVDRGDEEIFFPVGTKEMYSYFYVFHTHPPTPKPGGRVEGGILYEFPSVGDLLHFIDHHNDGKVIGSLVMTPEGLYNIRKIKDHDKKINIDEDSLYNEMRKESYKIQRMAISEYGEDFTTYKFYSVIAQNNKYINMFNKKLEKYGLTIDFFPRSKDFRGSWVVDTIYVPL